MKEETTIPAIICPHCKKDLKECGVTEYYRNLIKGNLEWDGRMFEQTDSEIMDIVGSSEFECDNCKGDLTQKNCEELFENI